MITRRRLLASCLLLVATTAASAPQASFAAGEKSILAVIVAKNFPVDGISFGDLKRLYMGTSVIVGGKNLIPLTYPKQASERIGFDQAVLGMEPDESGRFWIDRRIRGQSGPPKSVDSADVIIKVVTRVDGAIGFVKANSVGPGVKVLKIDGKTPRDPGYRLAY